MNGCSEILEKLRMQTQCVYISDLHQAYLSGGLRWISPFKSEADGPYAPEDWTQAVLYITGVEQTFCSGAEAIDFLTRPPGGGGGSDTHKDSGKGETI